MPPRVVLAHARDGRAEFGRVRPYVGGHRGPSRPQGGPSGRCPPGGPPGPLHASERRSGYPSNRGIAETNRLPKSLIKARSLGAEMVAVLASPVILFYAFRLRAMSSAGGVPDPGLHTSYIWDPQDTYLRFTPKLLSLALQQYLGPPAAYLREGRELVSLSRPGWPTLPSALCRHFSSFATCWRWWPWCRRTCS